MKYTTMVAVEELTYEKIHQLKTEQDKLVTEGKIKQPAMLSGFSIDDRIEFEKGLTLDNIMETISKKHGFVW